MALSRLLRLSMQLTDLQQQCDLQPKATVITTSSLAFGRIQERLLRSFESVSRRRHLASAQVQSRSQDWRKQNEPWEKEADDELVGDEEDNSEEKQNDEVDDEVGMFGEMKGSYPDMSAFLDEALRHDKEIQGIFENVYEAPEEMGKRVNERIKRKEKDIIQTKTGSSVPMKVSFCEFDATDSYIWIELYSSPSKKELDIIGSAIRAWYVLGCLGGYNSLNIQLTKIPMNERLRYKEYVDDDPVPARFVNVSELEFQHNLGRFWVDLGISDPLSLDVIVNAFTSISSDYVGIKELTFGGKDVGHWNEEITSEEEGYMSFKI